MITLGGVLTESLHPSESPIVIGIDIDALVAEGMLCVTDIAIEAAIAIVVLIPVGMRVCLERLINLSWQSLCLISIAYRE